MAPGGLMLQPLLRCGDSCQPKRRLATNGQGDLFRLALNQPLLGQSCRGLTLVTRCSQSGKTG